MKKATAIWLITGGALLVAGCVIMIGVLFMINFNLSALSTGKYEMNGYEITEEYQNILIATDTADVQLEISETGDTFIECFEKKAARHSVTVEDGTLKIEISNEKKWYDCIGINFTSPKIRIWLPEGELGSLTVHESTGDVSLSEKLVFESIDISVSTGDVTADGIDCSGDVSISVTTGDVQLSNFACKSLNTVGSTGDVKLSGVIAAGDLTIRRSTGDVRFNKCDGAEVVVKTKTGDVSGSFISGKEFIAEVKTGSIHVPESTDGGKCSISTTTGDIYITIE